MARRRVPPPVELTAAEVAAVEIPAELLAGPAVAVWVSEPERAAFFASVPPEWLPDGHPPEGDLWRWVQLARLARRRWADARERWARSAGLDQATMWRLLPDRAPR